MRGRKGAVKGVPIYKKLSMTPRAVRAYYWIQEYVSKNEKFPRYCDIGEFLKTEGQSDNYYTLRDRGIDIIHLYLEPNGFVRRENRKLYLTDKPMTDVNIVIPTDANTNTRRD
jgi:hypothetical protein